jgi:hypothetical protein
MGALENQVGGDHYKKLKIQPIEFSVSHGLGPCEMNIVKYASRYKAKNGAQDIEKIGHYIDLHFETLYIEPHDTARARLIISQLLDIHCQPPNVIIPEQYCNENGIDNINARHLIFGVTRWRLPGSSYTEESMKAAAEMLLENYIEENQ